MKAERVLLETDAHGHLIDVPKLPPNARLEAIFLVLEEPTVPPAKRTPPAILKGSVSTVDAAIEPTISEEEWEASLNRTARQIAGEPEGDGERDPLMPSPGWPAGYFEETYGALAEDPLERPPQGDFREIILVPKNKTTC
jgi:hypothetical protein